MKGQNSTHSYAVYTRNFALHFEVVWLETPQVQLEISAGCGMGQRPLKSPQSSVKSLVWWLIWRGWGGWGGGGGGGAGGGVGGVRISSGVGGHEDPFHHLGLLMPQIT